MKHITDAAGVRIRVMPAAICLALAAHYPGIATGQEASVGRKIEEIVVSAQKAEQQASRVPVSISVLSADDLKRSNTTQFADLTKVVSGFYINAANDGQGQGVSLRGVGSQPFVSGIRPGVAFVLNDIANARTDSIFTNLADVESIEILKGPQSTLWGRESSSGLVSITTRRPELGGFSGRLGTEFGSDSLREYNGSVNVPLGERAAVALSYYNSQVDGQIENVLTGREQSDESQGGRISLLWQPADSLELLVRYGYSETEVRDEVRDKLTYGRDSLARLNSYPIPLDEFDRKAATILANGRDMETQNFSTHISWDMSDRWTITSISGYTKFEREYMQGDPLPTPLTGLGGFGVTLPAGTPTGGEAGFNPFYSTLVASTATPGPEEVTSQEFRLSYSGERLDSIYGFFYMRNEEHNDTALFLALIAGGLPLQLLSESERNDWAVFTHQTYTLSPRWEIVGGLRYSVSDLERAGGQFPTMGYFGFPNSDVGPSSTESWDNVSGTLKLVYAATETINLWGSISQGFKPGGFEPSESPPWFKEETTINYEIGVKTELLENTLRFNASAYYQTYDDFQVQAFNPATGSTTNIVRNAAEVIVQGVEFDFLWLASDNLTIDGAFAYTDARTDDYENAPCSDAQRLGLIANPGVPIVDGCVRIAGSVGQQDLSGKRMFQTSPYSANVNVEYEAALTDGHNWFVRGEVAYRDDFYGFNTLEPAGRQDAYTLFNASLGLRPDSGKWTLTIYGKNLADEDYIAGFLPGRDGLGGINVLTGLERTFGVTGRYNF